MHSINVVYYTVRCSRSSYSEQKWQQNCEHCTGASLPEAVTGGFAEYPLRRALGWVQSHSRA